MRRRVAKAQSAESKRTAKLLRQIASSLPAASNIAHGTATACSHNLVTQRLHDAPNDWKPKFWPLQFIGLKASKSALESMSLICGSGGRIWYLLAAIPRDRTAKIKG
jgi:hypothetical protein